jgi:hypothetical protein
MKTVLAILIGGLVAGALDIVAAFAGYVPDGSTELGILQYIASAVIGPEQAFAGGWATGAMGLAFHFGLTIGMAVVFVVAARFVPLLLTYEWIAGVVFGLLTYVVMVYVIVPHSNAPNWTPAEGWNVVAGLMSHVFYVGLPIALIAKRFA